MVAYSVITVGLCVGNSTAKRMQELGVEDRTAKQDGYFCFMNR